MVSLVAFMHWLETGTLLMHSEAEEMLGCMLAFTLSLSLCLYTIMGFYFFILFVSA